MIPHPVSVPPVRTAALPLHAPRDVRSPIARVDGVAVSAAQFVAEAVALARSLPSGGDAINLCTDRYRFALGFAAALLRGSSSLFPPNARPQTLALLDDPARRRVVLVDEDGVDTGGLPQLRVERVVVASAEDVTDAGQSTGSTGTVDAADRAHAALGPDAAEVPSIDGDLDAAVLLTSGSTGTPQPHAKRWRLLVRNIAAEAARLAEELGRPDLSGLTLVATVPPQHSYGFESTVLLALLGGATFDGGRPFYPADIVAALDRVPRPRALVTTPFHLKTLLASGLPLPPIDLLLSATAPLSPQLAAEAERATGGRLVEIYGCTEAGQVASRRTTDGDVWRTLGELRVWRDVPEQGEERYLVHGGHVEEPTPLADLLQCVDDRHFRLLGRANDLIHVGGKRSSLAHLNFHLNRVPGVVDGCFWLPSEDGETVVRTVAFVVAPGLRAADVIDGLRAELEPVFLPRRVVFVEALPREATGKLTAQGLREFALARLARGAAASSSTHSARAAGPATSADAADAATDLRVVIPADHPAFDGHFPDAPVLPGVVLLSELLCAALDVPALAKALSGGASLEQAKFLAPVGPGTTLRLIVTPIVNAGSSGHAAGAIEASDAGQAAAVGSARRWQLEARRATDDAIVTRAVLRAGVTAATSLAGGER